MMQLPPAPVIAPSDAIVSLQEPWAESSVRGGEIVVFVPGAVTCGGKAVPDARLEAPVPAATLRFPGAPRGEAPTVTLNFTISGEGRALGIRGMAASAGFSAAASDLAPALAASHFAPGAPREQCSVSYSMRAMPLALAPLPLVYEAVAATAQGDAAGELWDRARPPGSDCKRTPEPREIHYPAFETIAQPAGTRGWSVLAFDVDPKGAARNVRVLGASANPALERASVAAVAASRFVPGAPRQGCVFRYFRNGALVAAPPVPADQRDDGDKSACRIDPRSIPRLLDGSAFPTAFSRRGVEGWALVRYDTAPWGVIGNVKVVAAEPAEAFGEAARSGLYAARVAESETGRRGCMQRIVFRLPPRA